MKKIIFILHNTSRTGAPLVLFYFLQWLKENKPSVNFTILDIHGGNLSEEFKSLACSYYCLENLKLDEITFYQDFKNRILKRIGKYKSPVHPRDLLIKKLADENFDVIYANSALSLPVANSIKNLSKNSKLVLHVHELNTIIQQLLPDFLDLVNEVDKFIAVSDLVSKNLNSVYNINPDRIRVIYEFSKISGSQKGKDKDYFLVGGAGTVHWRKGSDLFIQIARYIITYYKEVVIKFEWVGYLSNEEKLIVEGDIQKAGLQKYVSFIGEKVNPIEYFKHFDLFLLCSREDPFPLVAIEVGSLGIPIICFEGATGTGEILKNGGGEIVPYLNIEMASEKIINYYYNRDKLKKDGENARNLFSNFTPEQICPLIYKELSNLLPT